jgi:hypothetical protein
LLLVWARSTRIRLVAIINSYDFSWKSWVNPKYPIRFSMRVVPVISFRHSIWPKLVYWPDMLMKSNLVTFLGRNASSFFWVRWYVLQRTLGWLPFPSDTPHAIRLVFSCYEFEW